LVVVVVVVVVVGGAENMLQWFIIKTNLCQNKK
jgi:hypothetical protein